MKKGYDKKVALKLINKYAENYNRILEENLNLQRELSDLNANITINKEIIETFFKAMPSEEKSNTLLLKYKEENKNLLQHIDTITGEQTKLRKKIEYYEGIINKSIFDYRESTDDLNNKIFILENIILKKENIITGLNQRLKKFEEENDNFGSDLRSDHSGSDEKKKKEIYIIDPSTSVNIIQDDLMLYKQAYEKALRKIKDYLSKIEEYEIKIDDLKNDLYKLQNFTYNSPSCQQKTLNETKEDNEINLEEILSTTDLSRDELELLAKTNLGVRILSSINRAMISKNALIHSLQKELNSVAEKNKKLTKENITLYRALLDNQKMFGSNNLSERGINSLCINNNYFGDNYVNTNISMIGNTSRDDKKTKKRYDKLIKKLESKFGKENLNQSADNVSIDYSNNDEIIQKNRYLTDFSVGDSEGSLSFDKKKKN